MVQALNTNKRIPQNASREEVIRFIKTEGRRDPVWFMKEVLGVKKITGQQKRLIKSVRDNRRTAAPAGHGIGKTYISACIVIWFLFCFDQSKVLTTAPTWFQVENLLWAEVRKMIARSILSNFCSPLLTKLKLDEDWFAVGLSTNDPTSFQGIHAPFVLIVFDEATGIKSEIWQASEGVAVGKDDRFLAIGNPTDPASRFKEVCDSPIWNVIVLSSEDHPNVTTGENVIPGAVTKEWIEERLIDYGGRESAGFRARVRGLFPEQGSDMLISLADVERARLRWRDPALSVKRKILATGADIARFGDDSTVIGDLWENDENPEEMDFNIFGSWIKQDTMATTGRIVDRITISKNNKRKQVIRRVGIDDSGLGGGVTDRMKEQKYKVFPFNGGEKAIDYDKFLNRRAEMLWMVREELIADRLNLPDHPKLIGELTNIKYSFDSKGRIKIEPKEDLKKRIGRSPDFADTLAIALTAKFKPIIQEQEEETSSSFNF